MGPRSKNRKRSIRRDPLSVRIKNAPFDFLLYVNEFIESIDWDAYSYSAAIPAGIAANAILLTLRLGTGTESFGLFTMNEYEEDVFDFDQDEKSSGLRRWGCVTAGWTLLGIALINLYHVVTKKRRYVLNGRPLDNDPGTSSAKIEQYFNPEIADENEQEENQSFFKYLWSKLQVTPPVHKPEQESHKVWALYMWDPPLFNLYFSTIFSPLSALQIWFGQLTVFNIGIYLPILIYSQYAFTELFLINIKDKTLFHSEVLSEYESNVVKPVVSIARKDAAIGLDGDVTFYAPTLHYQNRNPVSRSLSVHKLKENELLPTPVFPSNAPSVESTKSPRKLSFHPAGYYTLAQSEPEQINSEDQIFDSPLAYKSNSLFRRLHQ